MARSICLHALIEMSVALSAGDVGDGEVEANDDVAALEGVEDDDGVDLYVEDVNAVFFLVVDVAVAPGVLDLVVVEDTYEEVVFFRSPEEVDVEDEA